MISIHPIHPEDLADVAALHRESWRSAYRGIFSDAFLDSERVVETRLALWTRRLISEPSQGSFGYIARDPSGEALGFTFALPAFDAQWGSLLDNLHVRPDHKGQGIGRQLLLALSERCARDAGELGLYLWVFEANTAARAVYEHLGARPAERVVITLQDDSEAAEWRYVWPSPGELLRALRREA
ncbi:N-acetyltransferase family protein [Roseateles sp.]|uniref:GNAT family N-acetyltransferase n=1 Tax=Roseateles sp. TaxID=1971397 RepID=UPI003D140FFD